MKLLLGYHGTPVNFDSFNTEHSDEYARFGRWVYMSTNRDDVWQNYMNQDSPDMKCRIDRFMEESEHNATIATCRAYPHGFRMLRCGYMAKNPFVIASNEYLEMTSSQIEIVVRHCGDCNEDLSLLMMGEMSTLTFVQANYCEQIENMIGYDCEPGYAWQEFLDLLGFDCMVLKDVCNFFNFLNIPNNTEHYMVPTARIGTNKIFA